MARDNPSGQRVRGRADIRIERVRDEQLLAEIAQLARRIWREHYPGIISHAQIDYMLLHGYSPQGMQREIAEDGVRYALARCGGNAAGFTAHGPGSDADTLWLDKLYVAAEYRGEGLARALLADAVDHAREIGKQRIRLRVNRRNRGAISAYRRLGFRIEATDIKDIGGGFVMDDYVMSRSA